MGNKRASYLNGNADFLGCFAKRNESKENRALLRPAAADPVVQLSTALMCVRSVWYDDKRKRIQSIKSTTLIPSPTYHKIV